MRRILITAALAGVLSVAGVVEGAGARGSTVLAAPSGVRVAAVSSSSLVVAANRATGASGYRLFASARRRDLYAANLSRARHSAVSSTPTMRIGDLTYSTRPLYFRVQTLGSGGSRLESTIPHAYLRPYRPANVRLATSGPTYLTWSLGAVTGYLVEQAENSAMTLGRRTYALDRLANQFTPPGLVAGRTYWFRVYGVNHGVRSLPRLAGEVRATRHQQPISVMTYNVLEATAAGQVESGTTIPTWSRRRPGVVALIESRLPDVVAVQEAAAWVGSIQGFGGTRQIDDLTTALGGRYALARTEIPPTEHGYRRTGDYLLYRATAWSATDVAGHWDVGDGRWAAYQVLTNRTSGAHVLVISTHLAAGAGATNDAIRQRETTTLVRLASALAAPQHLPIVYAGDFNSDVNRNHAFDGPGIEMRSVRVADAEKVAPTQINRRYNSANLYLRTPPAVDQSIDYVYAAPGVAVTLRQVVLHLVDGRFSGVIPSDHNPVFCRLSVPY
jgi:endonuclease/exonuclease/phosphatase family metal-dependent hydrolase